MLQFLSKRGMARGVVVAAVPVMLCALAACDDAYGRDKNPATRLVAPTEVKVESTQTEVTAPVSIEVFAPESGSNAGDAGIGWLVDMEVDFPPGIKKTGFSGFQLTGPGGHANIPPFPRPGVLGRDESFPGLIVFCSTSTLGAGANLAGLFNITGLTNRDVSETELWATWIVAGPACGTGGPTTLWVAVASDLNHNGIYDDAPDAVPDLDHNGVIDGRDLQLLGIASNLVTIQFKLHP